MLKCSSASAFDELLRVAWQLAQWASKTGFACEYAASSAAPISVGSATGDDGGGASGCCTACADAQAVALAVAILSKTIEIWFFMTSVLLTARVMRLSALPRDSIESSFNAALPVGGVSVHRPAATG